MPTLISSQTRNRIQRKIPNSKRTRSYPAILIGRLGVGKDFRGHSIGSQILDYIKGWFFSPDNKSGCRFIVVDAYNEVGDSNVLRFYQQNGFKFLYPTEEEERMTFGIGPDEHLNTRLMYFDLLSLKA
ncbi:MAG: GNAT family N-acetyltransferase [Bacteroidales bacterium]|nr:GNAT family N-acetyltransferase [Bacteroidales bacterium]